MLNHLQISIHKLLVLDNNCLNPQVLKLQKNRYETTNLIFPYIFFTLSEWRRTPWWSGGGGRDEPNP